MPTWTFEQATSTTTSNAVAYAGNVKSGSLLIAAICTNPTAYNPTEPNAVTDSLGNTWTRLRKVDDAGNAQCGVWWYAISGSAGANTVTIPAGTSFQAYLIGEWSVDSGTISLDGTNETGQISTISTTTDSGTSGTITPSVNDALLVGFWGTTNGGLSSVLDPGTNWTERVQTGQNAFADGLCSLESRVLASPAATAATFTSGASSQGLAAIAAFKTSGGGGGTPGPALRTVQSTQRW